MRAFVDVRNPGPLEQAACADGHAAWLPEVRCLPSSGLRIQLIIEAVDQLDYPGIIFRGPAHTGALR